MSVHTTQLLPLYDEIRDFVASELTKVYQINSLARFGKYEPIRKPKYAFYDELFSIDGCEMESALDVGQNISVPCPCQEFLEMVPAIKDQRGWRACAGTYTHGAQLEQSSFTQCTTVVQTITNQLCQAVNMV